MKTSYPIKLGMLVLASAFIVTGAVAPALAKDKTDTSPQKFSIVQQGQSTVFTVTNNRNKAKTVDIKLDLVDVQGMTQYSYTQNDQKFAAGASYDYNMGSLMLNPAGSPYHVVFSVFKTGKNHKLIEKVDPAGTFTVYHGGCLGRYCH